MDGEQCPPYKCQSNATAEVAGSKVAAAIRDGEAVKVAAAIRDGEAVAEGNRHLRHGVSELQNSTIFASRPACVLGGRIVTTEEIAAHIPGWTAAEAIKRTGVERRHWIAEGETAVSLATAAAAKLLDQLSQRTLPLPPGEGRGEGGGVAFDVAPRPYSSPLAPREGNHHAERDAYYGGNLPLPPHPQAGTRGQGEGGSRLATLPKITAILCSATSPQEATPSISCQVLTNLRDRDCFADGCFALDFNAACSGFLYGLRLAFDHLQADASGSVLLLTSEIISPGISNYDPATAFLFGDAATATIVCKSAQPNCDLELARPYLLAAPDPDFVIRSPCHGSGFLQMNGVAVARTAYKFMADVLRQSANDVQISPADLAVVLPHPGSIRILQNVAEFSDVAYGKVWHTLADTGNTSSSSIPLALDRFWDKLPRDEPLGMTAFGAGFTAASVIAKLKVSSRTGDVAQASRLPAGEGTRTTEIAIDE